MPDRYDAARHHRRSVRLRDHDYAGPGGYYITLCVEERECLLGEVVGDIVPLNALGRVVHDTWQNLGTRYPYIILDEFVVMPNHLHGILFIDHDRIEPGTRIKPLGSIIGAFKTMSTKHVNALRGAEAVPLWQRNYYEHTIRDSDDLNRIRDYIRSNPSNWIPDSENPDRA